MPEGLPWGRLKPSLFLPGVPKIADLPEMHTGLRCVLRPRNVEDHNLRVVFGRYPRGFTKGEEKQAITGILTQQEMPRDP